MAAVQSAGSSELTTNDEPKGTLYSAFSKPELWLKTTGRPAERASSPVNPQGHPTENLEKKT